MNDDVAEVAVNNIQEEAEAVLGASNEGRPFDDLARELFDRMQQEGN